MTPQRPRGYREHSEAVRALAAERRLRADLGALLRQTERDLDLALDRLTRVTAERDRLREITRQDP